MRILVLGLVLFPLAALAADHNALPRRVTTWARPVGCEETRLPPQDRTICDHPEMHREDLEINKLFRRLLAAYKGQDRKVFGGGQVYWVAERRRCPVAGVAACVKDQMDHRLAFLMNLKANPGLLSSTVAGYGIVDPWYVKLFPTQYAGKHIELSGAILLQDSPVCVDPKTSRKGRLKNFFEDNDIMDAEFSADMDLTILCTGLPLGKEWDGIVKLDGQGHPYLYLTII